MSEEENEKTEEIPQNTEWVKPRISDEEIAKSIARSKQLEESNENFVKMLHQRDVVIQEMSRLLIKFGLDMIVLGRNAQGTIDKIE